MVLAVITVCSDLFRRHDVSGIGKALWVIALVVFPYWGFHLSNHEGRGMALRENQRIEKASEQLRHLTGFSIADELEKLERLKN